MVSAPTFLPEIATAKIIPKVRSLCCCLRQYFDLTTTSHLGSPKIATTDKTIPLKYCCTTYQIFYVLENGKIRKSCGSLLVRLSVSPNYNTGGISNMQLPKFVIEACQYLQDGSLKK
ncbi:hypothetical protein L2E82_36459 [Cichorium intybus]|uniref:Uncharacterized protein n=1 Tax=Cichorium intybus TaxID=13427 RepID=A0ACB9BRX9_CICIN|nr:hypothetical protein L2E82_36459 [Cichorium intybus]